MKTVSNISECKDRTDRLALRLANEFNKPIAVGEVVAVPMTWEERVSQLEAEGLTRSDAQGAVDVEILEGWRPSDFQPWMMPPKLQRV